MFKPSLTWWRSDQWPDNSPDSLLESCLSVLVNKPEIFVDYDEDEELYSLKPGIMLPPDICEHLLARWAQTDIVDNKFLHIFKNPQRTRLKRLDLAKSHVTDESLGWLMAHKPRELNIDVCEGLTSAALDVIHAHSDNLLALFMGNNASLFMDLCDCAEGDGDCMVFDASPEPLFKCHKLQALSIHGLFPAHNIILRILHSLKTQLVYLDLSECDINFEPFIHCLGEVRNLTTLILYDVDIDPASGIFTQIKKLSKLRALDLSQGREQPVIYDEPEEILRDLVSSLPHLTHLDLSGTNLPGFIKHPEKQYSLKPRSKPEQESCPIPGLEGRFFEFLGLLNCSYEVCHRENIPSKKVAGDHEEEQIILAVQTYTAKCDLLLRCLNNLFQLCRYSECLNQRVALKAILEAMKTHPHQKTIQISGSASLFYICKSADKHNFSTKVRRAIITTLLDGMESHIDETTMLRNGCLTLCHFKIPQDVLFDYERVVTLLLQIVRPSDQDEFVQHVGIYLLNSLACQVDSHEKQLVGELGAIQTMLGMIENRMRRGVCDEVMEIAWSTMWNVTDESAVNCERFIEGDGMELFQKCLKRFPEKEELLRNMMGLLGNVAEVAYLRPRLMHAEYVAVFSELLDSTSDGIEVSYNACGVLAHMVSDGPAAWAGDVPARRSVLQRMASAISRWKINTSRNINYRSFEPILRLLPKFHTPEAQHWAVWALCNLTKVYREKYCDLVAKENGLSLLEELTDDPRPFPETKELASQVVRRCRHYALSSESPSDDDLDQDNLDDDDDD